MKSFTITYSKGSRSIGVVRSTSSFNMVPPNMLVGTAGTFCSDCRFLTFSRQAERLLSFGPQAIIDGSDAARLGLEREIGMHEFQRRLTLRLGKARLTKIRL